MKLNKSLMISAVALTIASFGAFAQDFYDDDIYFDASKAKKEAPKPSRQASNRQSVSYSSDQQIVTAPDGQAYVISNGYAYPVNAVDYPAADTYTLDSGSTRDVDEYNRRFATVDSISVDELSRLDFTHTRDIERFSNPSIVTGSGDDDLMQYYADSQQPTEVNVYLNTPGYYYGWPYSYRYSPYYWNSWAWDPWYYGGWYDPYWSWGWGPSWSWGWGPSWSWGWGPSWRPSNPGYPGATRPHRPNGGYASQGGYRGNYGGGAATRPSSTSNGGYRGNRVVSPNNNGNYRPSGTPSGGYRPSSNGGYRPSGNNNGGYRPSGTNNGGGRANGTNRGSNTNRNNYNNNYNNNSSRSGSFSSPSRSSGGSFGGYRGGGGGGRSSGGGRSGGGRR